jgi:hypothetical protein
MMGVVHAAAWAYCLLVEWIGTPPAEWTGHRVPTEWTGIIKCGGGTLPASGIDRLIKWRGDTSPASGMDRRRALSAINAEAVQSGGLTSGSTRWLTSCAPCHVAASGSRLSGEQKHIR